MADTLKSKQSAYAAWRQANAAGPGSHARETNARLADEIAMVQDLRNNCQEIFSDPSTKPGDKGAALMASLDAGDAEDILCEAMGDTPFECSTEIYLKAVTDEGFEKVFEERASAESIYIFARPDGLILTVDTCQGNRNSAMLYFQLVPNISDGYPNISCSKSWEKTQDGTWFVIADMDVRMMLRHNLRIIAQQGTLQTPWVKPDDIGLRHCLTTSYDHTLAGQQCILDGTSASEDRRQALIGMIQELRLRALPAWTREMMGRVPSAPAITPPPLTTPSLH